MWVNSSRERREYTDSYTMLSRSKEGGTHVQKVGCWTKWRIVLKRWRKNHNRKAPVGVRESCCWSFAGAYSLV